MPLPLHPAAPPNFELVSRLLNRPTNSPISFKGNPVTIRDSHAVQVGDNNYLVIQEGTALPMQGLVPWGMGRGWPPAPHK